MVARARDNKLGADDLVGASFTLTNPGGIGTVASVPRLMPGQGAILAAGAIGYPPGFANANEQTLRLLGVGKVMQITSTYDHRVIQGAQSGEYLRRVDNCCKAATRSTRRSSRRWVCRPRRRSRIAAQRRRGRRGRPSDDMLRAVAAGMAIVSAYRSYGHLGAQLDPLGAEPLGDASLQPQTYGLTPSLQSAIPASVLHVKVPGNTLADVLPRLRQTYSSTIAYEIEHISDERQRVWLRDYIESGRNTWRCRPNARFNYSND